MKQLIDHSLTYKKISFRNFFHRSRLKKIKSLINSIKKSEINSYGDFGCSQGYLTNVIHHILEPNFSNGYDISENVLEARKNYPNIFFDYCDLNNLDNSIDAFDLVTCFETIEHVGNIENTLINLTKYSKKYLIITVPIEIGIIGILKFFIRIFILRSGFNLKYNKYSYFLALIMNKDISEFREKRKSFGTHFGFNYKIIDDFFNNKGYEYYAFNYLTTRFYFLDNNKFNDY